MAGFVEGVDRAQSTLFPALLDDYVSEDNPVRAVDVFVDGLDLDKLGFVGVRSLDTGRLGYHRGMMLKLCIYGYLNRVPASRPKMKDLAQNRRMRAMGVRRQTAEHPFGTIKCWMGATHFLTKKLPKVATEMALNALAYNMKRVMRIVGVGGLLEAMWA